MKKFFKRLTAVAVSIMTVVTMLSSVGISASAATRCGLDEIGGKILLESSKEPLRFIDDLVAYKFKINGETGYCIDPNTAAQKTNGETLEFTDFTGETGKEVLKLDPSSSNQKEKALIVGVSVFYGGYGDYFSSFKNGGKTAKSIMDSYIDNEFYSGLFSKIGNKNDKYYLLSHYALSQLYHEFIGDPASNWKAWSYSGDVVRMIDDIVKFANSIASNSGDYSAIKRSCQMNNYYICQPKGKDGSLCQHLIVRIPKKAKLRLQKAGSNSTIKDLTESSSDKDYLNFSGAQYTLYKKGSNEKVATAELNRTGNISKILYAYSNKDWINRDYFELTVGNYYLKETKAPNSGRYFTLDDTEYSVTITAEDCEYERTLDVLKVTDKEIVKLKLKKVSSNPEISDGNDCYDLDGAAFAIFGNERSAYEYIADNSKKNNIVRYFITDGKGDCKAISEDGNNWDYNLNSDLYKITYSDTLYAVEIEAPKGFKLYNKPVKLELSGETSGGYAVLSATIADVPANDPVGIRIQKKNSATGQTTNMEGAEFTVCYYKGYYTTAAQLNSLTPERKWVLKTDSDSYCQLGEEYRADSDFGEPFYFAATGNPALPLGTVTIQETKAPEGFKINPELFIRQIKFDEETGSVITFNEIEVLEEPEAPKTGKLEIVKSAEDSKRSDNTAKDVWFNIKSDDNVTNINVVTTAKGLDGTVTVDNLPLYKSNGALVKYTITELGYKNADGTYTIPDKYIAPAPRTITLAENKTVYYYAANRLQKTALIVEKESEDGIVSGFYFSVVSDDGKTNTVLVTGEDGRAELNNLAVYNSSNKKIKYTVDELGFKNADGTYYFPAKYNKPAAKTVTLEDGKAVIVQFYNSLKRGSVELTKTDGKGNLLNGIEFKLYSTEGVVKLIDNGNGTYDLAGSNDKNTVTTLVTDSEGGFLVENLLPGDYYFLETNSKGNMPYADKIEFTISADKKESLNLEITVENNKVIIPKAGGTGNNRSVFVNSGVAVLALTILVGAIGIGKKKKHHGKKVR